MEPAQTPPRHPLIRLIAAVFLISIFLGILPVFPRMFRFDFLPSYRWMSAVSVVGEGNGLFFAAAFVWFGWKRRDRLTGNSLKKIVVIVSGAFFGFFMGQNAVLVAPPMIAAIVAGHEVETSFTVESADEFGASGCRSPIELRDLPFFFDKVCRVSRQFRSSVPKGAAVKVTGHGTELGLFVKDIDRAS